MTEYAVQRAREMFQARQAGQSRRADSRRLSAPEAEAEPDGDPGDLIGALQLIHSRLRRLDGWLRAEHRLNLTEMHVLSVIPTVPPARRTRGDAAARLARAVEISPSGLTRLVDRLVTRGLVSRVEDSWDRRVTHLVLTERGRAVRDVVLPRAVEHIRDGCGDEGMPIERLRWVTAVPEAPRRP
ncbi:MarR family winged helix-turn-helix transcriptional regulator [Actinoallomurus sp. NBC_01490]|uniref:MarR family winged helix-turn-helix transcriptional regulator n=1 Tax=Actinoallomurus sp. NBC_01490 TaxID=2903557 RepID=UPI002E306AE5|nr:MarR family winged helix-turn-helix transcriptional regulator [Actinoallomurus sp. NBC_01490]